MIQCPRCGSYAVHYEHHENGVETWRCWHLVDEQSSTGGHEATGERCDNLFAVDAPPRPTKLAIAPENDILDFEGIGAEMWQTVDTDEHLRSLRNEWEKPTDE